MASYRVKAGDTLAKIAKRFYEDPNLAKELAHYNGMLNPDLLLVGETLQVPTRKELLGPVQSPEAPAGLQPPHGLEAIKATFGDINAYLRDDGTLDPAWEDEQMTRVPLPFPIPYSLDRSLVIRNLHCHVKWQDFIREVFSSLEREGLKDQIKTCGDCFCFRSKRTGGKFSTHCWGIAIDLNPETNQQGTPGDMDEGVVEVFRRFGFKWGSDWSGKSKDPMHFQFCTGY